jgi:coenzyme F420 hydrogenase subunit beta
MEQSHGLDELNRTVIAEGRCAACGACVSGCPYLTSFRGKTVVLDRCTKANGRCFQYCPMTFFDAEAVNEFVFGSRADSGPLGQFQRIFSSRAVDRELSSACQAGGVVTALMLMALEKGVIDCAVLTRVSADQGFPRGVVASTPAEITACAGAQYAGAHSLSALREALDKGFQRIGVVALPCQVRSLRKMALYDLAKEGLQERIHLVVGLFCNWAFSAREFQAFLSSRVGSPPVKRFHIPPPPAGILELHTEKDVVNVPLDEVRPLIQAACRTCPDMTAQFADISVGMHEGKAGWNTVIERTARGRKLIEQAEAERKIELEEFPAANLDHLAYASAQKRLRATGA